MADSKGDNFQMKEEKKYEIYLTRCEVMLE